MAPPRESAEVSRFTWISRCFKRFIIDPLLWLLSKLPWIGSWFATKEPETPPSSQQGNISSVSTVPHEVESSGYGKTFKYERSDSRIVTPKKQIDQVAIRCLIKKLKEEIEAREDEKTSKLGQLDGLNRVVSSLASKKPIPGLIWKINQVKKELSTLEKKMSRAYGKLRQLESEQENIPLTARRSGEQGSPSPRRPH
jgi:hypothetical protein